MIRYSHIDAIVLDLERRLKAQKKPGKAISREKMRFREKLSRLSDGELAFLAQALEKKNGK